MATLTETAAAKINLTLGIAGRRPDGYHELVSLVAFADVGDRLSLAPGPAFSLEVGGPFAAVLGPDNLVCRAVRRMGEARPGLRTGAFRLEKVLPIAAGLGGGSADAAAALRLLMRANSDRLSFRDLEALAPDLGADVTVCLEPRAALMWGIGEKVRRAPALNEVPAVLVNPGVALATAEVYAALQAPPLASASSREPEPPGPFADLGALVDFLERRPNDLEPPARRLAPQIREIETALAAGAGCRLVRLSGSGATVFGLFATPAEAASSAARIAAAHPQWWVRATTLR